MGYSDLILADSPVAYWRLGESSGTTAVDASGNGHHGAYQDEYTLGRTGALHDDADTAISLSLLGAVRSIGGLGTLGSSIESGITIEFLVKYSGSDARRIFAISDSGSSLNLFVEINQALVESAGSIFVELRSEAGSETLRAYTASSASINDGQWHHVVIVITTAGSPAIAMYVDAVAVAITHDGQQAITSASDFDSSAIGGSSSTADDLYLDEVAIYSGTLSAGRIAEHVAGMDPILHPPRVAVGMQRRGDAPPSFPHSLHRPPPPSETARLMESRKSRRHERRGPLFVEHLAVQPPPADNASGRIYDERRSRRQSRQGALLLLPLPVPQPPMFAPGRVVAPGTRKPPFARPTTRVYGPMQIPLPGEPVPMRVAPGSKRPHPQAWGRSSRVQGYWWPGLGALADFAPASLRHYDWEPPAWAEFASGPTTAGAGATLTQSSDAAFPDRVRPGSDGLGLLVTLSEGTGTAWLQHALGTPPDPLYVRIAIDPGVSAGGSIEVLRGVANTPTIAVQMAIDADTRTLALTLAESVTLTGSLTVGIGWHVIEFVLDVDGGEASLRIDGIEVDSASGLTLIAPLAMRVGCTAKDAGVTGEMAIDEWRMSDEAIGLVTVEASANNATAPERWLAIYNLADEGSIAWAESYRAARGLPYANLCGLTLPTTEEISAAQWATMRDSIVDYLVDNDLSSAIDGLVLGHGCPGTVDTGVSIVSLLADLGDDTADQANPLYQAGVLDVDDLPERAALLLASSGRRLVAEANAPSLVIAQALSDRIDALHRTRRNGQITSELDPATDRLAIEATGWSSLATLVDTLQAQQVRLPTASGWDASTHGHAVEFSGATAGAFSVAGQQLALLATCGDSAGDQARGAGLLADALTAGYASVWGHVGEPGAGQMLNPAAFLAACRAGWTLAEAWAVAVPTLASSWRVIGDPLGRLVLPLQGYHIYRRLLASSEDELVAVAPAGSTSIELSGLSSGSDHFYHVRAVSVLGVEDEEPTRLKRVRLDEAGAVQSPLPNAISGLRLQVGAGGMITVRWSYIAHGQAVAPASFRVFAAIDGAFLDYGSAAATQAFILRRQYSEEIGPYTHGARVQVRVLPVSAAGAMTMAGPTAVIRASAQAPDAPSSWSVEVD